MRLFVFGSFAMAISILGLSKSASAMTDLERADALFKKRGEQSFAEVSATRTLYNKIYQMGALSEAEKLKVATQIGRLDIYRGGLLPELQEVPLEMRIEAIDSCLELADSLEDSNSPQYHYLKVTCTAYRGKLEDGVLGRMKYGLKMRKAQGPALEVAASEQGAFEGGGIYRVMSALRGNRKAKPLGLYDAQEALSFASQALQSPAVEDVYFEEQYSGEDYFENYYYQAQAKLAVGIETENVDLVQDARSLLNAKIRKIDALAKRENGLRERKPETLAYRKVMNNLKDKIDHCSSQDSWKSCLIESL